MKLKIVLGLVLALGALGMSSRAQAASGLSPCELSTTSFTVCAVGAGSYYGGNLALKTAPSDFVVCFDTPTANGGPATNTSAGTAANPIVDAFSVGTASNTVSNMGQNRVIVFNTGLICYKNATTGGTSDAIVYFKQ